MSFKNIIYIDNSLNNKGFIPIRSYKELKKVIEEKHLVAVYDPYDDEFIGEVYSFDPKDINDTEETKHDYENNEQFVCNNIGEMLKLDFDEFKCFEVVELNIKSCIKN